ncbi:MAG: heparinase II/III family protein [Elusimicrobiota bacterium]
MVKTKSTVFTAERVSIARENIAMYKWAKDIKDKTVANAAKFVNASPGCLWELATPQPIPRGITVNLEKGCPNCGNKINCYGNYPWKIDVFNKPWKIECPSCGEVFPKNDFAKFYESGRRNSPTGEFEYEKADRSLLFNTDHPNPTDPLHTYGVDDTFGWKDKDGTTYRFLAYYGHFGTWSTVLNGLTETSYAYIYNGDSSYARIALTLLYRIATLYPGMDYGYWANHGCFNSDGGSKMGKIFGRIWETGTASILLNAYDAAFPALSDPELCKYLSNKTGRVVDAVAIQKLIEKNVVHEIHDGIITQRIRGNEGMHQHCMTLAGVVLDDPEVTDEWLDWIFQPSKIVDDKLTGGNMQHIFDEKVDDDGMGNEASPGYNGIWRVMFRSISEVLEHYPRYKKHSFIGEPKYKQMFLAPVRLTCIDKYCPNIGDCHRTGCTGTAGAGIGDMLYAYRVFGDDVFAQLAYYLNNNSVEALYETVFDPDPEIVAHKVENVINTRGEYVFKTDSLPSYGCTILRSGKGENARAVSLYHGRNTGHGHKDTLNIELFAHGLSLMPDLGYPEYATVWAPRAEWTTNTISHNTVVVDKKKQENNVVGNLQFVMDGNGVHAVEVTAPAVYPQTSLYQRTVVMVDVSDTQFYIVDIFRVKGGKDCVYSLHGAEGEVVTEGLNIITQTSGTLAGETVPPYADLGGIKDKWNTATGYQYLYNICRDKQPSKIPVVEWKIVDTWKCLKEPKDVRLRVTLLSPPGEVILAQGDPPRNKVGNPRRLWYLLSRHEGGETTFASIIEPYIGGMRVVDTVTRKDNGDTVELTVKTVDGRVDTIVSALDVADIAVAGLKTSARFAVVSTKNGIPRVLAEVK